MKLAKTAWASALVTAVLTVPLPTVARAGVVATEDYPNDVLSLLHIGGQQGIAHAQVASDHTVVGVAGFNAATLSNVDVVYNEYPASAFEVSALANFANNGGRVILASDHGGLAHASHFDVAFANGSLPGTHTASVFGFANPITNGPAGVVNSFSASVPNGGLTSTNPEFQVLARYESGEAALGYLPYGAGQIVFLTDLNTFDDARLGLLNNQQLWTNLFDYTAVPEPATIALLTVGSFLLIRRGSRRCGPNDLILDEKPGTKVA